MRSLRTATVALVAAATIATPLATTTTADAAPKRFVISVDGHKYISPNGDHSRDKFRLTFSPTRKSVVTVKVRRANKAQTLVYRKKLGTFTAGSHRWVWNGKNHNGKVVRDGEYRLIFVAEQVAKHGKKRMHAISGFVDTKFTVPPGPTVNSDTVYPRSTIIDDAIGISLGDNRPEFLVDRVKMFVKDAKGRTVRTEADGYRHGISYPYPVQFDGRDDDGDILPAGPYQVRFKVWDRAGNVGKSKRVTVQVSHQPLVETTGSTGVPLAGAVTPAGDLDGRESTTVGQNEPQPRPCGTVVHSEIYPDPGALSVRSSDACEDSYWRPHIAKASGSFNVTDVVDAPRGLTSAWMSMRGRPTVDGETDTAELAAAIYTVSPWPAATSAPSAGESVTTTGASRADAWRPSEGNYNNGLYWSITTRGVDSYDVAGVTVHFTYLAPQIS